MVYPGQAGPECCIGSGDRTNQGLRELTGNGCQAQLQVRRVSRGADPSWTIGRGGLVCSAGKPRVAGRAQVASEETGILLRQCIILLMC